MKMARQDAPSGAEAAEGRPNYRQDAPSGAQAIASQGTALSGSQFKPPAMPEVIDSGRIPRISIISGSEFSF